MWHVFAANELLCIAVVNSEASTTLRSNVTHLKPFYGIELMKVPAVLCRESDHDCLEFEIRCRCLGELQETAATQEVKREFKLSESVVFVLLHAWLSPEDRRMSSL